MAARHTGDRSGVRKHSCRNHRHSSPQKHPRSWRPNAAAATSPLPGQYTWLRPHATPPHQRPEYRTSASWRSSASSPTGPSMRCKHVRATHGSGGHRQPHPADDAPIPPASDATARPCECRNDHADAPRTGDRSPRDPLPPSAPAPPGSHPPNPAPSHSSSRACPSSPTGSPPCSKASSAPDPPIP